MLAAVSFWQSIFHHTTTIPRCPEKVIRLCWTMVGDVIASCCTSGKVRKERRGAMISLLPENPGSTGSTASSDAALALRAGISQEILSLYDIPKPETRTDENTGDSRKSGSGRRGRRCTLNLGTESHLLSGRRFTESHEGDPATRLKNRHRVTWSAPEGGFEVTTLRVGHSQDTRELGRRVAVHNVAPTLFELESLAVS